MPRTPVPDEVARRVRAAARNRCGYCLSPQHLVMARIEIEHIVGLPDALAARPARHRVELPYLHGQ